jgi:diguanylate cyclase (GGDEF)-like protein
MGSVSLKNPGEAASVAMVDTRPQADAEGATVDTRAILTAVEEVAYEWTIADDRLIWDANALSVLGVGSLETIATGRRFAALLDPQLVGSRHDAVLGGKLTDDGSGVRYETQYALLPDGPRGRRLMVEDVGRWYADGEGRPARACGVVRIINDRYEREQRLAFLSRYDELTGYLNRAYLLSRLGEALSGAKRARAPFALMIIAVDNFRAINEAYGFEVADQMFATIAHRIKSSLREGDAIGRFSGNKLGVIVQNCGERDMHVAAERFHAAVRNEVIAAEAGSVAVTVSIGGVGLPRHGRSVAEALARAEEALSYARRRGHGHFVAYAHSRERAEQRRANAELSGDLVAAFNQHQFVLGFQPIVEAATRQTAFHEALLRLRRPNNPVCEAGDFVALAERLGLIRLIDRSVLDLVFDALAKAPDARLSFNISAETVGDGEWLSRLSARVAATPGFAAKKLLVEITETSLMRNLDEATRFVALLRDLGCEVALDDFGAGFSSFRSLRELGVDVVKIDGGFVEKLRVSRDDRVFVRTLIDLARNLGIKTVAERVQDEESAAILAEWGVDYLQGNLTGAATLERPPSTAGG